MTPIPRLLEPQDLQALIANGTGSDSNNDHLVIIDLCNQALYNHRHVPGAVHLPGNALVAGTPPVPGAHPGIEQLNKVVNYLGINDSKHVILYDDEGGGWAGRLAWSLDLLGLHNWSYLNGGIVPWVKEGFACESEANQPKSVESNTSSDFANPEVRITMDQLLGSLNTNNFAIWDARSPGEYSGDMVRAARGGHIPGAIHLEWTDLMDQQRNLRIRDNAQEILDSLGFSKDKHIATHCQSHHRSSFTYMVARILGYQHVAGYDGSWAEWGNSEDSPIALGNQ